MGEGPNKRKYESANQISAFQNLARKRESLTARKHFQGLKRNFGRKKNGRSMKKFQIVTDRRWIETNFVFQEFRYKTSKILLH